MANPLDPTWHSDVQVPLEVMDNDSAQWNEEVDVAVVGFGGAGACAALEASDNGARVMAIDRFQGGGATALSGGVTYTGGGTRQQKQAGVEDTPEEMFKYLTQEVKGVVEDTTLKIFCDESVKNLEWLESKNVTFDGSLCPHKTSYPISKYRLYYSGNESVEAYSQHAKPAPRGHIAKEKPGHIGLPGGFPGGAFYRPLKETSIRQGVILRIQSNVRRLIIDKLGAVIGLETLEIPQGTFSAWAHKILAAFTDRLHKFSPGLARRIRRRVLKIEKDHARLRRIRVKGGVILSAGGFVLNRNMLAYYAPKYKSGGLPLGTTGDDGSGIRLGESVGGAKGRMDRVSAWRFINPPMAWAQGIVVNTEGERFCNEAVYGAKLGEKMCEDNNGRGFLIIDRKLYKKAMKQILPWKVQTFQLLLAIVNMFFAARKAQTIEKLANLCRIPPDKLVATVKAYNDVAAGAVDPLGKARDFIQPINEAPYYAMDVGLGAKMFVCAKLTFGGLVVDEKSGQVKREDGSLIPGLYAAGRNAVGVASNSYVSGLSIADCVFSGRRAGRHAAKAAKGTE